jgi:hypothetical protein
MEADLSGVIHIAHFRREERDEQPHRLLPPVSLRMDLLVPHSGHVLLRDVAGLAARPDVAGDSRLAMCPTALERLGQKFGE